MKYTPRPYAKLAMDHLAGVPRCALWAKPGMGKTVMVLTHLNNCIISGEDAPTLVLGPKRVAQNVWTEEAKKWTHLSGLDVVSATGTVSERVAALKRDAQVVCTNYDNLVWLREHYRNRAWPFRTVVPDEATRLKSFRMGGNNGKRAKALGEIAHKDVRNWINLTGTPAPNGLVDLWGQTWFIDAGQRLGRTFEAFQDRYFAFKRVKDALTHKPGIKQIVMPYAHELIHEKLADICMTLDPRDWFDIQEPRVTTIEVDLSAAERSMYRELERELFLRLGDGSEIEVFGAAQLTNKCLQFCNGQIYLEGGVEFRAVHDQKLDALESLIEELAGAPLLVAYHYAPDLERLKERFPDALVLSKAADMRAAKAGEGAVWLGQPGGMGHGVDGLQEHCCDVAFFSHWWDFEHYEQIIERVGPMRQLQAGKDRVVNVYHLVVKNSIDEVVVARRLGKADVQQALLDYMKGNQ